MTALARHPYLTDGRRLLEVLESDHAGALCEDLASGELVSLEADELAKWRAVTPAKDAT